MSIKSMAAPADRSASSSPKSHSTQLALSDHQRTTTLDQPLHKRDDYWISATAVPAETIKVSSSKSPQVDLVPLGYSLCVIGSSSSTGWERCERSSNITAGIAEGPRMDRDAWLEIPRLKEAVQFRSTFPERSSSAISTIASFSKSGDLNFDLSRLNNTTSFRPSSPKDFSGVGNKDTISKDNTSGAEAKGAALLKYIGLKICRADENARTDENSRPSSASSMYSGSSYLSIGSYSSHRMPPPPLPPPPLLPPRMHMGAPSPLPMSPSQSNGYFPRSAPPLPDVDKNKAESSPFPRSDYFPGWTPEASFYWETEVTGRVARTKGTGEVQVVEQISSDSEKGYHGPDSAVLSSGDRAAPFVGARDWAKERFEKFSPTLPLASGKPRRRDISSSGGDTTAIDRRNQLESHGLRLRHETRDREESHATERDQYFRWEQGLQEKARAESTVFVDHSRYSEDDELSDRRSHPRAYARTKSPATATSTQKQQAQNMNAAMMQNMTNNSGPWNAQQLMQARYIQQQQNSMRAKLQTDEQLRAQANIGLPGDTQMRPGEDIVNIGGQMSYQPMEQMQRPQLQQQGQPQPLQRDQMMGAGGPQAQLQQRMAMQAQQQIQMLSTKIYQDNVGPWLQQQSLTQETCPPDLLQKFRMQCMTAAKQKVLQLRLAILQQQDMLRFKDLY